MPDNDEMEITACFMLTSFVGAAMFIATFFPDKIYFPGNSIDIIRFIGITLIVGGCAMMVSLCFRPEPKESVQYSDTW